MVTYRDILNRARARQAGTPLSATGIGDGSGDSLQGIQALNNAVSVFSKNSYDLDATEKVASIITTASSDLLTAPTPGWDTNVIKAVNWLKTGATTFTPLVLLDSLEKAEEYKLKTFDDNYPRYWYVNGGNIYILPESSTGGYALKVFYQQMYVDVTADNVNDTIILPASAISTLVDGAYAYLREQAGDPQWMQLLQLFEASVKQFYARNKYTLKRQGKRLFRVRPQSADRRL